MKTRLDNKIIRFIIAGCLNIFFGCSVYAFFIVIGMTYEIAFLISTVMGISFNYLTIKKIVFKSEANTFFLFVSFYIAQYFLGIFLIEKILLLTNNKLVAGLCVAVFLAPISFMALSKIFYEKK